MLAAVNALVSIFKFPDGSPAELRTAGRMLFGAAVILCTIGLSGVWDTARGFGTGAAVGAIICWATAVRHNAERAALLADRKALLKVIAEMTGHKPPPTGPLRVAS